MSIPLKSIRIKLLVPAIIMVFLIVFFLLTKENQINIEDYNAKSIILQKGVRDTNQIELLDQEEINNFIAGLDLENWHKASKYDLKCGPEYIIIFDEDRWIEILCFSDMKSYCKINNRYYVADHNVLEFVSSIYNDYITE